MDCLPDKLSSIFDSSEVNFYCWLIALMNYKLMIQKYEKVNWHFSLYGYWCACNKVDVWVVKKKEN